MQCDGEMVSTRVAAADEASLLREADRGIRLLADQMARDGDVFLWWD